MEWSDFDFMVWRHEWRYQCQKYFFRHNLQWSFLIRCKNFTILNISKFKKIFSKSSPFWGPGELINQKWNWKLSLTRYPVQFPTFWAPVPAKKLTELWQFQNMWFSDDWLFCSWVIWEFANTQTNKHTNRHTVGHIYQNVNFGNKFWQVIICFFTTGFFGFSSTEIMRKKSRNYTGQEKERLLDLIEKHQNVLYGSFNSGTKGIQTLVMMSRECYPGSP